MRGDADKVARNRDAIFDLHARSLAFMADYTGIAYPFDKVDLVLWHYKDPRLQSQQEVQEARDRAYNYVAEYRVASKKFVRLADDTMRDVTVSTRQSRWGFGTDDRAALEGVLGSDPVVRRTRIDQWVTRGAPVGT